MARYLLDVNVLLALFDPGHISHDSTHEWWANLKSKEWATCPLTENGFARVISNPKYPSVETDVFEAFKRLKTFANKSSHKFWPDSISLIREDLPQMGPNQITDYYLIVLAKANQGQLATLDKRLVGAWKGKTFSDSIELIP